MHVLTEHFRQSLAPIFRQQKFNSIINCHDAEDIAGFVNDRKGQQIVLGNILGHIGGPVIRMRYLQIAAHHLVERRRRIRENQITQSDHSD